MTRLLIRIAIFFATAAIGLLVAGWLVPGFAVSLRGFWTATLIFAVAQSVMTPFAMKLAHRYARGLLGGIGLVSTFLALLLASLVSGGISIRGLSSWVIGTLVVWIVTALGAWLLPIVALKKTTGSKTANPS